MNRKDAIEKIIKELENQTDKLENIKKNVSKEFKLKKLPTNIEILQYLSKEQIII